jgi:glutaredoxin 3
MVKEFLSQKGVSYIEHDISRDRAAAQELVTITGQMAVPVTVIDGEPIIGFDRARLETALSRGTGRQEVPRPSFGASVADAGKITSRQGAGIILGAYVGSVRTGSLAERMGLAKGDIITEVNKQGISNAGELEAVLSRMDKGSYISIVFLRNGQRLNAEGVMA